MKGRVNLRQVLSAYNSSIVPRDHLVEIRTLGLVDGQVLDIGGILVEDVTDEQRRSVVVEKFCRLLHQLGDEVAFLAGQIFRLPCCVI